MTKTQFQMLVGMIVKVCDGEPCTAEIKQKIVDGLITLWEEVVKLRG